MTPSAEPLGLPKGIDAPRQQDLGFGRAVGSVVQLAAAIRIADPFNVIGHAHVLAVGILGCGLIHVLGRLYNIPDSLAGGAIRQEGLIESHVLIQR